MSIKIESPRSPTFAVPSPPARESAIILLTPLQTHTENDLFSYYQNRFKNHKVVLIKIGGWDIPTEIRTAINPSGLTKRSIVVLRAFDGSFEYRGKGIFEAFPQTPLPSLDEMMMGMRQDVVHQDPDKVIVLLTANQKHTEKKLLSLYKERFKDRKIALIKILGWDIPSEIRTAVNPQELNARSIVILRTSDTAFEYRGLKIFDYFPHNPSPLLRDTLAAMKQEALHYFTYRDSLLHQKTSTSEIPSTPTANLTN